MNSSTVDLHLTSYMEDQALAEAMIPVVGRFYRERGVIVTVYGRKLMNGSTIDIIKAHRLGRHLDGGELSLQETSALLTQMEAMNLGACRVDIGRMARQFRDETISLEGFLARELGEVNHGNANLLEEPQDVVLYGFGRIGRIMARMLIERTGLSNKLRLRAVVVRGGKDGDLEKRASLLRRDSIHGPFNGSITVDHENSALIANGNYIKFIYANKPEDVNYEDHGIKNALVVDNTGVWKDRDGLGRHLVPGAAKVLLTAPAKGDIKNIVFGVNEKDIDPADNILCAASCTTNAITPVLKVLNDRFGIRNGHVETVHSYTNDQNLIDNYHSAERRGRSAPLNMVITSTGAAKAVAKALPELKGKLTGNAIRVPTPNVSMAVMNLNLESETTREELNDFLRQISLDSDLSNQIGFTASTEVVSSDLVGSPEPGVVDAQATIVDGDRAVLYVWYDNEYGYTSQVLRVVRHMAGMHIPSYPAR
ncbi:MAG: glyceraldehyde-3-phosphate dehydrogenase [Gammaproteobacteria bacterium]|nr:glyceraldehyde-3-phosphate dehydrogenase [Gammaproteobacteria bacterium]